jgi:O-Antigen ligase/Tetratricopeptide repeat
MPSITVGMTSEPLVRTTPVVILLASALAQGWLQGGSTSPGDWLPVAVLAALMLATILAAGPAKPHRLALAASGLLVALSGWQALSLTWSPLPEAARNQALLALLYGIALAVPLLALRTRTERLLVVAILVACTGALTVATAVELRFGSDPARQYLHGRLDFPITYWNADAAFLLIGLWPALLLTARRSLPAIVRALALAIAVGALGALLLIQSKGAAMGLLVSALVVFTFTPGRLRLLTPTALATVTAMAGWRPFTAPYDAAPTGLSAAIRHAAGILLLTMVTAIAVGLGYAGVDRRLNTSERTRRRIGASVIATLVAAVVVGLGSFLVLVDRPGHFLAERWANFKHLPTSDTASTHFLSLGSNRYDFWRVSLIEFSRHPLNGIGAAGFQAAYLQQRRSPETPARPHSLELELLSEDGIVGLALLAACGAALLAVILPRARRGDLAAVASLGAGVYWLAHTSADWIWSFPAVGVPLFVLLGTGAAGGRLGQLERRSAISAAVLAVVAAVYVFGAPWMAQRLTSRALDGDLSPTAANADLRWARALDPISTDPLVTQSTLAGTPSAAVEPLEQAVAMEPHAAALQYLLGLAYLRANRKSEALAALGRANALDPNDSLVVSALRRARSR